jgi:hypothetical protein
MQLRASIDNRVDDNPARIRFEAVAQDLPPSGRFGSGEPDAMLYPLSTHTQPFIETLFHALLCSSYYIRPTSLGFQCLLTARISPLR